VAFDDHGSGDAVLLIPPTATSASVWAKHQVPAIVAAGYRAVPLTYRGTPPLPAPVASFRLADLVNDAAALITELQLGPCLVVGASLGAMVGQELALARPDLVRAAALLGTRCRTDFVRGRLARASADQARRGEAPSDLDAIMRVMQLFSAATLADDRVARDWVTLVETFSGRGLGPAMQFEAALIADRTAAMRQISTPCLVVAFSEDQVTPPAMGQEVAAAIPGCRYAEIPQCGHFGFLEQPDAVNALLLDFFRTFPASFAGRTQGAPSREAQLPSQPGSGCPR
jgi:pimeloyl-ACP methyl ester carboxylesterase